MKRAVFLDRDGVINKAIVLNGKPYAPVEVCDLEILPGVYSALKKLQDYGLLTIVVTNQPDVANGKASKVNVESINDYLLQNLPINEIRACFHNDGDKCLCRKPLPGMLFDVATTYNIDLSNSFMVGDRWRDIDAGSAAGCTTYFIDYGYQERQPENFNYRVACLEEAVENILRGFM